MEVRGRPYVVTLKSVPKVDIFWLNESINPVSEKMNYQTGISTLQRVAGFTCDEKDKVVG